MASRFAGRAPPGNILISKIFAFVFKKRERSGAERSRTRGGQRREG